MFDTLKSQTQIQKSPKTQIILKTKLYISEDFKNTDRNNNKTHHSKLTKKNEN